MATATKTKERIIQPGEVVLTLSEDEAVVLRRLLGPVDPDISNAILPNGAQMVYSIYTAIGELLGGTAKINAYIGTRREELCKDAAIQ